MVRAAVIIAFLLMPMFSNAQDAFKQYQVGGARFSMSVDMRVRDAGPSAITFVSDAVGEGAIVIIKQADKESNLKQLFNQLQEKNKSCIDTSEPNLQGHAGSKYYASEMTCNATGDQKKYRYIAAIQTRTAIYTFWAECPLKLQDKYRPIFRKAIRSFDE